MSDSQREAVRSNAKYLRNVRPIDPDEISEYVDGQPHPAVVKRLLREEALDLGLVERADGTFTPPEGDPVAVEFRGVEAFPVEYARKLEDLLVEAYGVDWPSGDSGETLRETIRRQKEDYFAQNPVEYDYEAALAYAVYHLPDYYAVVQYVVDELAERGLLARDLRVLDVGAGVGGPALGLHDYLPEDALVEYHAVEPSDAADVLEHVLDATGRNFHPTVHRETAEAFDPEGEYDLILFGNVLSELADPEAVARRYADHLVADGSVVAVAPADRNTSVGLREVERALEADGLTVYSPTVRLWPGEQPADEGWSFDVQPDIETPRIQERLDDGSGEFVNADVQYSHSILRADGKRRKEFAADAGRAAKMADSERHVTDRVDLVAVKLSHDLADDGHPLFKVGDGSEKQSHFAVLTKETSLNRDLAAADYGDVLAFEQALVLWNDDEDAYNLVVDDQTVVDRIPV